MPTGFVIGAILVEENSLDDTLTGPGAGGELTTHLFGLRNHAGTIRRSNAIQQAMAMRDKEGMSGPSRRSTIGVEHSPNRTNARQARLTRPPQNSRKDPKVVPQATTTSRNTAEVSPAFEWIPVQGDPTARRRARAHISRGIRRRKAQEEAQAQQVHDDNAGSTSSSSPGSQPEKVQSSATSAEGSPANHEVDVRSAQTVIENLILKRTLGTGGGSRGDDPFQCFPVKLTRRDQAILDHCKWSQMLSRHRYAVHCMDTNWHCKDLFVYAPGSLTAESRASFQGIKNFSFDSALQHPSAFHVVLALGASQ
jgi:hypothetical protein